MIPRWIPSKTEILMAMYTLGRPAGVELIGCTAKGSVATHDELISVRSRLTDLTHEGRVAAKIKNYRSTAEDGTEIRHQRRVYVLTEGSQ